MLHLPLVQDDDLIGHLEGLALIVGDEQARDMNLVVQFSQPDAKLVADLGVESPEGLVQQQHLRARRSAAPGRPAAAALPRAETDSGRRSR